MKLLFTILLAVLCYNISFSITEENRTQNIIYSNCEKPHPPRWFRIFGVKIKAKHIIGVRNFNDLGLKYTTNRLPSFTDDTTTFVWRLGAVRLDTSDFTKGSIDLFNLSVSNHQEGYPLLDSIDFSYYMEHGFQIVEYRNDSLKRSPGFSKFKNDFYNAENNRERRRLLWLDSCQFYREQLLKSRFFYNTQKIKLDKKVTRIIQNKLLIKLDTDINSIHKLLKQLKRDNDSVRVMTKNQLRTFLYRSFDKDLHLSGDYMTVVFHPEYINRSTYLLKHIGTNDSIFKINDEFNENLKYYIEQKNCVLNSAIFCFKLNGDITLIREARDSIKLDLESTFNIDSTYANLILSLNSSFEKTLKQTFKNEFSKVWIFMFGTDNAMDEICLKDLAELAVQEEKKKGSKTSHRRNGTQVQKN